MSLAVLLPTQVAQRASILFPMASTAWLSSTMTFIAMALPSKT
jgi:hypothetical protein